VVSTSGPSIIGRRQQRFDLWLGQETDQAFNLSLERDGQNAVPVHDNLGEDYREPEHPERRAFYELCWLMGGSQGDMANLTAEDVDWDTRIVNYRRQKTKNEASLHFGDELAALLRLLPQAGPLFPRLRASRASDRATEFKQRCAGLKIRGVTLHSYRYAWAERAKQCGYPERFAQEACPECPKVVRRGGD
jgi:integrase